MHDYYPECPVCKGNPLPLVDLGWMPLSVLGLEEDPVKSELGKGSTFTFVLPPDTGPSE